MSTKDFKADALRPASSKRSLPSDTSSRSISEPPRITVSECIAQKYAGDSQLGKYHGKGEYTSEQGTYVGDFFNGTFHGKGTMHVKEGRFEGHWEYGVMVDGIYVFDDNLNYKRTGEKYWDYCSAHDFRFQKEILENVPKDGKLKYKHSRGNDEKKLLPHCYDFTEGYYDPKRNMICTHNTDSDIRTPNEKEVEWIVKNCRVGGP